MKPDRWQDIERLYEQAMALPVDQRAAFLNTAGGGDDELRREVESLINLEPAASGFLEQPAIRAAATTLSRALPHLTPPDVPGCRIIRELGEGGMGVVYLAEQLEPLQRVVALKLIRPGMDSRQVLMRFERERQALARMDHPNIAAVFDAGYTADLRPYFVMEFVDGVSITEYCDSRELSVRARLSLFIQVCNAVQHAHQKGIIHRDLKPSNVLVIDQDGQPVPKVIDFGTAKSADQTGADTGLTSDGLLFGTVEYMSPEQVGFSTDIDTTTDVYSLGVLLYELLVGSTPFTRARVETNTLDAILEAIRHSDPPRPSALISRDKDLLASVSARGTDVGTLTRQLSGDLDWIVLKALEKDRRRRYQTAASLGADVQRFQDSKPIEARQPSVAYRVRKFTRRYRGAVAATAALALTVIAALVTITALYLRSERNGAEAERQRANAQVALRELAHRTYAATIAASDLEARSGKLAEARSRLLEIDDAQRNWEWWYLFNLTDENTFKAVSSTLACESDVEQPRPMSSFDDSQVLRWDSAAGNIVLRRCGVVETWATSGSKTGTYSPPADETSGIQRVLAVDPGSTRMLVVGRQPGPARQWTVKVFDARAQRVIDVGRFTARPSCADVAPDGERVVLGFHIAPGPRSGQFVSHSFEVWKVGGGRVTQFLPESIPRGRVSFAPLCHVRFSPDGNLVASSGATVDVWNAHSGVVVRKEPAQSVRYPQPVAFSRVGERLAIGRPGGAVEVVQLAQPAAASLVLTDDRAREPVPSPGGRRSLSGLEANRSIVALAFSDDGSTLASGAGQNVTVWDLRLRKSRAQMSHQADVIGVAMSPDGRVVYSSDIAGRVRGWTVLPPAITRSPLVQIRIPMLSAIAPIQVSEGGTVVAGAGLGGGLSVLRLPDLRRTELRQDSRSLEPAHASALALSADGTRLYVENGGGLQILTSAEGESVQTGRLNADPDPNCSGGGQSSDLSRMAISRDDRYLAFSRVGCVLVWDTTTLERVAVKNHALVSDLMFRSDGALIIAGRDGSAGKGSSIEVWDWKERKTAALIHPQADEARPDVPWRLTQSADGRRIGLLSDALDLSATLLIRDHDLQTEIGHLQVGDSIAAALSPDGSRAVTVSAKNPNVQVWDTLRATLLLTLIDTEGHSSVRFTKSGQIIAGRWSGGVTIWDSRHPISR